MPSPRPRPSLSKAYAGRVGPKAYQAKQSARPNNDMRFSSVNGARCGLWRRKGRGGGRRPRRRDEREGAYRGQEEASEGGGSGAATQRRERGGDRRRRQLAAAERRERVGWGVPLGFGGGGYTSRLLHGLCHGPPCVPSPWPTPSLPDRHAGLRPG